MPYSVKNFFNDLWRLPADFWIKIFAVILVLAILAVIFKRLIQISQVIFALALLAVAGIICVTWVRDRSEPAFMTPVVNFVASLLPSSTTAPPQK